VPSVWKEPGKIVYALLPGWIDFGHQGGRSAQRRNPHDAVVVAIAAEDDHAVTVPRTTRRNGRQIAKDLSRPSGNVDLLQFSVRLKGALNPNRRSEGEGSVSAACRND